MVALSLEPDDFLSLRSATLHHVSSTIHEGFNVKLGVLVASLVLASLQMSCGDEENSTPATSTPLVFTTGQAASLVIGQTSMTANTSDVSETTMNVPGRVAISSGGALSVSERNNSRVIVFNAVPTANGATADSVLGHAAFTDASTGTSTTALSNPNDVASYGSQLFIADWGNHRVTIYNSTATNAAAAVAIGQTTNALGADPGGGVSSTTLRFPQGVSVASGKIVIADGSFNRVLLYNSIPSSSGAAADVVLGQANMTSSASSASTMTSPAGVWTDGTKIAVCEKNGHRCLFWNSWPTVNNTAPDVILGQSSLATNSSNNGGISASSLANPVGVTSNGTALVIADSGNNRVLYWNAWPTANKQNADLVFGQSDFTTATTGLSATKFSSAEGVTLSGSNLFVADTSNNRVLIFKKQ